MLCGILSFRSTRRMASTQVQWLMHTTGLHDSSNIIDYANAIEQLNVRVNTLEAQLANRPPASSGGGGGGNLDLKQLKELSTIPVFDGSDKTFDDFEFKLRELVSGRPFFGAYLDWVKNHDDQVSDEEFSHKDAAVRQEHPGVDL